MNLICAVCGGHAPSHKQWWNRDTGYGVCARCFTWVSEREGEAQARECYGVPGVHHSIDSKADREAASLVIVEAEPKEAA